jgi:POT family proton-dependent oligopeptide transporter
MAVTSGVDPGMKSGAPVSSGGYRTAPDQDTTGWPSGIPYIVGNEACERFSYYGMRAILSAHLVLLYLAANGVTGQTDETIKALPADVLVPAQNASTATTHLFFAGVYALPMIGAIIADRLAGKYKTILYLSLVYCVGNAVLAFGEQSRTGMYLGLALIAIGSGGIKPCVSANVGDQFGKGNWFRVRTVYQIFYFSINFGSFFASLLIPYTRKVYGPAVAFGVPGVLMFIATLIFWVGRKKFVHVPPRPGGLIGLLDTLSSTALFMAVGHLFFTLGQGLLIQIGLTAFFLVLGLALFAWRQRLEPDQGFLTIMLFTAGRFFTGKGGPAKSSSDGDVGPLLRSRFWGPAVDRFGLTAAEGPVAVLKLVSVFVFVSVFWALFDQKATTWIRQAERMDLTLWGDTKVLATQVQALNPLLVMALIPLMNVFYGLVERWGIKATTLRRMAVGLFLAALAFVCVALLEERIVREGPGKVWFAWQVIAYVILTTAEVMVSTTGLEFAYTQAPKAMKSTVMGFWLLAVTLGNILVAMLARLGTLSPAQFFWAWAGIMGGTAVLFAIRCYFYVPKDYPQE